MENENEAVTHKVEAINQEAKKLKEIASGANVALTEMRLQFETMMEIQRQERADMAKLNAENEDKIRKHYRQIIFSLSSTLAILLLSVASCAIYFFK